ncbi:hypothetical protein CLOACE_04660 [Clostridium acetireducens DSM 10703]|uniref:CRISPR type III-B/RAMP module-associated protein Cmr5 n=1 Tax=Clostridium acetireducens DSM 10703 TaxID=1121290 RepID=A0A1E8F1M5_9CLOT|nr:hypothetical protein [Clostridium acetireducens]OFI07061.1 hypothetical protein CLOACE_04660 [Clostridium acetireducens DSM 10703]
MNNENKDNKKLKDELIAYVDEIFKDEDFWLNKDNKLGKKGKELKEGGGVGSTNIRGLANTALNADSYKEFKLYMQYKTAKCNGWEMEFKNNEKLGDVIVFYLEKIYSNANKDDKIALKNISQFFGYFYWKKKVIESLNEKKKKK